jgi:Putative redox-active protein (C_GCAxxG_C_C)
MMPKAKCGISPLGTAFRFIKVGTCSEVLINVLDRAFDHPLEPEEHASMPFAGGIMQHGYQCGMIWGAVLAAGAQAYRLYGPGPQAETRAIIAAQRLVESFQEHYSTINCSDIAPFSKPSTKQIFKFIIKGGPIGCLRMAARYAPEAFNEINTAFDEKQIEAPSPPVSCAAMLAQKMGASDLHTVMAAGFAGGIGLCGGACGALGAAIWIIGMNSREKPGVDNLWKDDAFQARVADLIESFLKNTDYKFECSEIVGRKFENIGDHAAYLRDGGCSKIIEVLAAI